MAYTDSDKLAYGGDLMIFISNQPIAFSKSAKLSISMDTRDISSKDSGNFKELISGRLSWNMSTEGLLNFATASGSTNNSIDELYTAMIAKTAVTVVFASKSGSTPAWTINSGKKNFTGSAYITSLEMNASDNEDGTYSISLEGSGTLTMA